MIAIDRFPFRKATSLGTVLALATGLSAQSVAGAGAQQTAPATESTQSKLQIQHDPIPCVTTSTGAAVDAVVNPGPAVSVSRVMFRAAKRQPFFYYVLMAGTPPSFAALIPRPEETTTAVEYHIEAVDRTSLSRQTPEYVAPVLASNACKVKGSSPGKKGLGLTIGLTDSKQPPIPPGFKKEDIARVILVGGTVVTLATALQMSGGGAVAGAAAGGGISTGVLVAGGVVAAAGVYKLVEPKSSKATPTPTVVRFVEADVTWSGVGDVDIVLIGPGGTVPATIPENDCSKTGSRTERVVLQGTSVQVGHYQVRLTGKSCGPTTPTTIAAVVTVQADGIQVCPPTFVPLPPGGQQTACDFDVR